MSPAPHPTDVEVSRSLNALVTTLNDRRAPAGRADDLQAIVTGALGGEQRIHVRSGSDPGRTAELADGDGKTLARLERVGGRWVGERVRPPRSGGYVPSTGGGSS